MFRPPISPRASNAIIYQACGNRLRGDTLVAPGAPNVIRMLGSKTRNHQRYSPWYNMKRETLNNLTPSFPTAFGTTSSNLLQPDEEGDTKTKPGGERSMSTGFVYNRLLRFVDAEPCAQDEGYLCLGLFLGIFISTWSEVGVG